jgi:hypothetical protein
VSWLGRFGLHLAAALGATGIFVAAAAVGANQTRTATEVAAVATPGAAVAARIAAARPERSIAGSIRFIEPDAIVVQGPRGREFRVTPAPGALIRLNGRSAQLGNLQPDDKVVILGQLQPRNGGFVAHAITARRK